jgi:hypothetical protein
MSVYGEMLLSFPEQFINVPYFDMQPLINDSYGQRENQVSINCIIQNKTSGVKDSNGNLVRNSSYYLWATRKLIAGKFIEWQGHIYRLIVDNDWLREGGFWSYEIEKLVGSNGNVITQTWENGSSQI